MANAGPRPRLKAPVFEIGLKGYCWGAEAVRLAVEADRLSAELGVSVRTGTRSSTLTPCAVSVSTLRGLLVISLTDETPR